MKTIVATGTCFSNHFKAASVKGKVWRETNHGFIYISYGLGLKYSVSYSSM